MKGNLIVHRDRGKAPESRWGRSGGSAAKLPSCRRKSREVPRTVKAGSLGSATDSVCALGSSPNPLPFPIHRPHHAEAWTLGERLRGTRGILSVALVALTLGMAVVYLDFMAGIACAGYQETYPELSRELDEGTEPTADAGREFPVPIKPLPRTITPCRACHGPEKDFPVNFQRREALLVHKNVKLNHGDVRVWCLDCHDPQNRNFLLALSDGKPISFDQSYRLCGKCHGTKYRDWRYGIHGRRTGNWNGEKTYYLCVSCHDPHSPRFKPLQPMPPPAKPWTPKETKTGH